jgi:hypothetical protein
MAGNFRRSVVAAVKDGRGVGPQDADVAIDIRLVVVGAPHKSEATRLMPAQMDGTR